MSSQINNYTPPSNLLEGKYILVTGAGAGLGRAVARAAARHGATVVLLGRTLRKLETVYDEIEADGGPQPAIYPLDHEGAAQKDYETLADSLRSEFGGLHGLVHCAALLSTMTPCENFPLDQWFRTFNINVHGPFLLTQACLPLMRATGDSSIIFTLDDKTRAYWGAYGVTKAAVDGMMHIIGDEVEAQCDDHQQRLVTCNGIDPGPMNTRIRRTSYPGELPDSQPAPEQFVNAYLNLLGRRGEQACGEKFTLQD